MSNDVDSLKCFFLRHSMTVIASSVLSALIAYGVFYPEATIASEKFTIFALGGVLYALGWIRGHLDGLCEASREKSKWK